MTDDLPQNGSATLAPSDRLTLIREAFRLEWLTIGWMTVEAAVSIAAGITANSLVLIAFGLDSVIELASAGVLMWRLLVELRHGQKFSERAERIASRTGGAPTGLLGLPMHILKNPLESPFNSIKGIARISERRRQKMWARDCPAYLGSVLVTSGYDGSRKLSVRCADTSNRAIRFTD